MLKTSRTTRTTTVTAADERAIALRTPGDTFLFIWNLSHLEVRCEGGAKTQEPLKTSLAKRSRVHRVSCYPTPPVDLDGIFGANYFHLGIPTC